MHFHCKCGQYVIVVSNDSIYELVYQETTHLTHCKFKSVWAQGQIEVGSKFGQG